MSDPTYQLSASAATPERDVTAARAAAATAPGRCVMYAICSDLTASPFDAEPSVAGSDVDIAALDLPYELPGFQAILDEWRSADRDELKREYSGLFEVGSEGPPVPIREDLHRNQPAGVREDIVGRYRSSLHLGSDRPGTTGGSLRIRVLSKTDPSG